MNNNPFSALPFTICLAGIRLKLMGAYPPLGGRSCLKGLVTSVEWILPGGSGWGLEPDPDDEEAIFINLQPCNKIND